MPTAPVYWFAADWPDPQAFDAAALQACGVTGVIAVATPAYFDACQPLDLPLDVVRGIAEKIKARAGSLDVLLSFNTVRYDPPRRTLCHPKDTAARTRLLNNFATIGRVCREFNFGLSLNAENMQGGLSWPDEPGARELGADLARACRRDFPALRLSAYGPLGRGVPPGFIHVWKGVAEGAVATGDKLTFWTEDSYGMNQIDPQRALKTVKSLFTVDGKVLVRPGLGWDFKGAVPDATVATYINSAAARVQAARKAGTSIMLFRIGATSETARAALGKVLGGS